jgi:hypothetical protein
LWLVVEVLAIQGGIASVLEGRFEVGGGSSLDCCCWFQIASIRSYPFLLKEKPPISVERGAKGLRL